MSSNDMNAYGEMERSGFMYMYESLKDFFEKIDTLQEDLRQIRMKELEIRKEVPCNS